MRSPAQWPSAGQPEGGPLVLITAAVPLTPMWGPLVQSLLEPKAKPSSSGLERPRFSWKGCSFPPSVSPSLEDHRRNLPVFFFVCL